MRKILLLLILSAFILSACTKTPLDPSAVTDNDEKTPQENNESVLEESNNETEDKLPISMTYEAFEYIITAKDHTSVLNLSPDEKAKEFLSILALGQTELIQNYFQCASTEEYAKAKFDFKIAKSNIESKYDRYEVKTAVTDSTTDNFQNGEYDYTLILIDDISSQVGYFGPTERVNAFLGENIPDGKENPALKKSQMFVEDLMKDFNVDLTIEMLKDPDESFKKIYHTVIHSMLSGTFEEYKQYLYDRLGYTNEDILNAFENELKNDTLVSKDENGMFNVYCGHGYSKLIYDLSEIEREGGTNRLTYTFYADSAHMIPCVKKTFVFEENKYNDIMLLTDIETVLLSELKAIRYMI